MAEPGELPSTGSHRLKQLSSMLHFRVYIHVYCLHARRPRVFLTMGDAQSKTSPPLDHPAYTLGQVNTLQTHQPFQSCSGDSGVTFLSALPLGAG